jgi:ZIP family zinc transporter
VIVSGPDLVTILKATIIGLVAGVTGTGAGGVVSLFFRRVSGRGYSIVLGFSAGVMISVVAFDLTPESIENGGVWVAVAGLVSGVVVVALLDLLPHTHFMSSDSESSRFYRAGVIVGLGIAMHNLPEGLAIGAGYCHELGLGIGLALVIGIHNFPEGLAMASPMVIAGVRPGRVVLATVAAGLPMGVGALAGAAIGSLSPMMLSISLALAGGAMLFVTCDELIPDAQELGSGHSGTIGIVAGTIVGIMFTSLFNR